MTILEFDRFTQQGIGYTGAVKFKTSEGVSGCCGCVTSDSSIIVFYSNGSAIDLWTCQGCSCLQEPVKAVELPSETLAALYPGASLPEEVCSSCCYDRKIPEGAGGFAEAWNDSKPIVVDRIDLLQASLINASLKKELSIALKQLESCKPIIVEESVSVDPFDAYIKEIEFGC